MNFEILDLLIRTLICLAILFETWGILTAIKGLWEKVEKWQSCH